MEATNPQPQVLSESELAEVESRKPYTYNNPFRGANIILSEGERDALCATVRAAWAEIDEKLVQIAALRERLAETERERNSLRGLRGQVVGLNTRLAQVEQERNDLRSSLDAERRAVNVLAGEIKP